MSSRDVIQISLGSSANAVTAHSLNLQGLAATDPEEGCDASTTHRLERNHWVPRCLLVDEPTRFFASSQLSQGSQQEGYLMSLSAMNQQQPFEIQPMDSSLTLQHIEPNPWTINYQALSSTLAYSAYSRYYQEPAVAPPKYRASQDNDRHVNWDDDDEEEEHHYEEDPQQRQARKVQEYTKWQRDTLEPLQTQLNQSVEESLPSLLPSEKTGDASLSWMDFWMPPYSHQSKIALEHSHQSHLTPFWDSYHPYSTGSRTDWMEDVLLDHLRRLLEESDACQGFLITTQGHGIHAGLTTAVLHELQEETKSAARFVFHVTNPESTSHNTPTEEDNAENPTWQAAHVQRVRRHISNGLALHDFTQNAHIVVPLVLPDMSLFRASAQLALALEACTLPIRLGTSSSFPRRIGLTNAPFLGQGGDYDMQWGSTAHRLSMSEYMQCLQPSSQYKVLELDTLAPNVDNDTLWQSLLSGTSLEQDARMRNTGNSYLRPRDMPPGKWLQPASTHGGLLTGLSPISSPDPRFGDRSLHHHFSMSTSLRPAHLDPSSDPRYQYDPSARTISHYLTATIQGMGITHRPERSVATIGSQSVGHLTYGSPNGGGAGAYWKSLLTSVSQPTLSLLGNSTRVYSHLHQISSDMKMVLGPRFRGYHQRDLLNGVLPEAEDCQEAMETCFDLRDIYHPPDGSGLLDDDDGDIDR